MNPASHQDDARQHLFHAVNLCHPEWEDSGGLTFAPGEAVWDDWIAMIFVPLLFPALQSAVAACACGDFAKLTQCDAMLDSQLPSGPAARSRLAGARLMDRFSCLRGEKIWARYQSGVLSEKFAGHLAVAMAIRGRAFHLPLFTVAAAYIIAEARAGMPKGGIKAWMQMTEDCLRHAALQPGSTLKAA